MVKKKKKKKANFTYIIQNNQILLYLKKKKKKITLPNDNRNKFSVYVCMYDVSLHKYVLEYVGFIFVCMNIPIEYIYIIMLCLCETIQNQN